MQLQNITRERDERKGASNDLSLTSQFQPEQVLFIDESSKDETLRIEIEIAVPETPLALRSFKRNAVIVMDTFD